MPKMLVAEHDFREIVRRRRHVGHDRRDEVWNGAYFMAPASDNFHDSLATQLAAAILQMFGDRLWRRVHTNCNVSDRYDDWAKNYRIPDVAVFLEGNAAEDRRTHWFGGPDLACEIVSPGDRSRKKIGFYESVGVRELWILERNPWAVEMYALEDAQLKLSKTVPLDSPDWTPSAVLPLELQLRGPASSPRLALRKVGEKLVYFV